MLPDSITHRTCTYCRRLLPLEAFGRNRSNRFGRTYVCGPCNSDYHKKRYAARKKALVPISDPENHYRVCPGCNQNLPLTGFRKDVSKRDGYTTKCRKCITAQRPGVVWLRQFKKTHSCEVCGESTPCCLDFHHRDPNDKAIGISEFARVATIEQLEEEIGKCVVLCSNCHRKVHAGVLKLSQPI